MMYTKIIDPNISIYNGNTNEFIASGRFNLSPETENDLLRLVNYNITPESLLLLNLYFYQQSTSFNPPTLDQPAYRKGILRAIFVNSLGELVPIEIRIRYDARARGNLSGNQSFFESVLYNNIEVDSVDEITY